MNGFSNCFRMAVERRTPAFSCGARLAFKLKGTSYLKNMLSRRQLQGFVSLRARFKIPHKGFVLMARRYAIL
jgi:hypothetical protein